MVILKRQDRKFTVFKVFTTFVFNILVKINYYKWIVFKSLQLFLTKLISFITIMEIQSYTTFTNQFKWISKSVASVTSDESSISILCSLEWPPMQLVLQFNQWFHDWLIFFFHHFLLLEWTFVTALIPPHVQFSLLLI